MVVLENVDRWETSNVSVRDDRVIAYEKGAPPGSHRFIDYGMLLLRSRRVRRARAAEPRSISARSCASEIARGRLGAWVATERFHDIGTETAWRETDAWVRDSALWDRLQERIRHRELGRRSSSTVTASSSSRAALRAARRRRSRSTTSRSRRRAAAALDALRAAGYCLVVVTNQPDVARGSTTRAEVDAINAELRRALPLDAIYVCFHDGPDCECRKPRPGMLLDAARDLDLDLDTELVGRRSLGRHRRRRRGRRAHGPDRAGLELGTRRAAAHRPGSRAGPRRRERREAAELIRAERPGSSELCRIRRIDLGIPRVRCRVSNSIVPGRAGVGVAPVDPELSVVVPIYNEAGNIPAFLARLLPILRAETRSYEVIFCADPCTDESEQLVMEARDDDDSIKLVVFSRRFGQPAATLAGIELAIGRGRARDGRRSPGSARADPGDARTVARGCGSRLAQRTLAIGRDPGEARGVQRSATGSSTGSATSRSRRHRRLPAHGPSRRRPAAPLQGDPRIPARPRRARRLRAGDRRVRAAGAIFRQGELQPLSSARSRSASTASIGFSTALLSLSTIIGFAAAFGAFVYGGRRTAIVQLAGNKFPVGNPTIVVLILLIGGHPAHLPRHHGPVHRADLRRGEAPAAFRRRPRGRLRLASRATRARQAAIGQRPTEPSAPMSDDYTIADHEFRDDDVVRARKVPADAAGGSSHSRPAARSSTSDAAPASSTRWRSSSGSTCTASSPTPRPSPSRPTNLPAERCDVQQLGIEEIPGEHVADVIVMHDVLEHIEDEACDGRCGSPTLLKPDGVLVMSVPALPSLVRLSRRAARPLPPLHAPTRCERALEPTFRIDRLRYYGTTMIPITLWFSRMTTTALSDRERRRGGIAGRRPRRRLSSRGANSQVRSARAWSAWQRPR